MRRKKYVSYEEENNMILLTILLVAFVIISIVLILGISFLGWSFWLLFGDLVVFIGIIVSIIVSIIKNKKDKKKK